MASVALAMAVIALPLAGCSTTYGGAKSQTGDEAADEAAISEFNKRYLGAINDGDIATLSKLTTEGHIMLAPGRPPTVGKQANDAANGRAFERFRIDETWTPLETVISGDLAYQRGTFTVNAVPKAGGDPSKTTGNFLRIYRKQPDGAWRMVRDMFNSDAAAPAPNACSDVPGSARWARTELYFGLSKPNGSLISEEDFQRFLDSEVTPRFREGFSVLNGRGQFLSETGALVKESSRVVILLYPAAAKTSVAVDDIRKAYRSQFQQESVLRVDDSECVTFQ